MAGRIPIYRRVVDVLVRRAREHGRNAGSIRRDLVRELTLSWAGPLALVPAADRSASSLRRSRWPGGTVVVLETGSVHERIILTFP
jgi:hypothetical protein